MSRSKVIADGFGENAGLLLSQTLQLYTTQFQVLMTPTSMVFENRVEKGENNDHPAFSNSLFFPQHFLPKTKANLII